MSTENRAKNVSEESSPSQSPKEPEINEEEKSKKAKKTKEEKKKEAKRKARAENFEANLIKLVVPISFTMFLVLYFIIVVTKMTKKTVVRAAAFLPYKTSDNWEESIANAATYIAIIIVATCLIVLLLYCNCFKVFYFIFGILSVGVNFIVTFYILCFIVIPSMEWTLDWITVAFALYNNGIVGLIVIYRGPDKLRQFYICIICTSTVIVLILYLPGYTIWVLLALMIIWDLVAVLTPFGPLRLLVEHFQKKGLDHRDMPPGMIYATMLYFMAEISKTTKTSKQSSKISKSTKQIAAKTDKKDTDKPKDKKENDKNEEDEEGSSDDDDGSVGLGLGDFVFYSLLMGKVAIDYTEDGVPDYNCLIACYISIMMKIDTFFQPKRQGLVLTLVILIVFERPLPGLPISLALGLIFAAATVNVITPFFRILNIEMVFV